MIFQRWLLNIMHNTYAKLYRVDSVMTKYREPFFLVECGHVEKHMKKKYQTLTKRDEQESPGDLDLADSLSMKG